MLKLYYRPMACSLAARMALMQGGIDADYLPVDFTTQTSLKDGLSFADVTAKKRVPVLILPDGSKLTENAAVLQYIADLAPGSGLAPAADDPDRYRLQEWLSFVGTEVHKAFLFPYFRPETDDDAKAALRGRVGETIDYMSKQIGDTFLLGEKFSVADAYLLWALLLVRFTGVELPDNLTDYLKQCMAIEAVAAAVAIEREEMQSFPPRT
ncbi:glutathione binding-like protein [Parvularcula marina]|uniref:glutathione binding-like protein n=1 Tax=Parvularcula marina TaxID=2292771 RepID=UPI003513B283